MAAAKGEGTAVAAADTAAVDQVAQWGMANVALEVELQEAKGTKVARVDTAVDLQSRGKVVSQR